MKRALLIAVALFLFAHFAFCAVTTSDGVITLDFYEDTQSGIENRWILDFKVNDLGNSDFEELNVNMYIWNLAMTYDNPFNVLQTDYYEIGTATQSVPPANFITIPLIMLETEAPDHSEFTFYATPEDGIVGYPILGNFSIHLYYSDGAGNFYQDYLILNGPMGFAPVPEPMTTALFVFGAFFLQFITKRK
ncbi:MAG: hypothetical protein RBU23_05155 [Candidatus Auribacterota bacterium]|jgi:hypothetical protein|nr:hypothetical protein [Candidatus Auribacterota bacterium]